MSNQLFVILDRIDLGDDILGIFSTKENADAALSSLQAAHIERMNHSSRTLRIEEFTLDAITCESWWWKK
jgi:hypothetical protein